MTEEELMRRAIALAKRGTGHTSPNPLVGAVIAREGRILGEGWHRKIGGLHAEREALADAAARGEDVRGARMYVTLEPCCHHGKQPPCTDAILAAGISQVFVGSGDPNPKVSGKGIRILREAGVAVTTDFLREECDALNPVFFHYIQTGEPYVALKYAMTADGKTAANSGDSRWITGEEARAHVHALRNAYTGILAGIGTVLADDPLLTCRLPGGRNPVRIVLDSRLRIPITSRLVQTAARAPLWVACAGRGDGFAPPGQAEERETLEQKKRTLTALGVQVLEIPPDDAGKVSVPAFLKELGARKIDGILAEGGGTVHAAFLAAGKANHIYAYVGAQIFGGAKNRFSPVGGAGIVRAADGVRLFRPRVRLFGDDVLIEYDCANAKKEADAQCLPES